MSILLAVLSTCLPLRRLSILITGRPGVLGVDVPEDVDTLGRSGALGRVGGVVNCSGGVVCEAFTGVGGSISIVGDRWIFILTDDADVDGERDSGAVVLVNGTPADDANE